MRGTGASAAAEAAPNVTALPDWSERNRLWLVAAIDLLRRRIDTGETQEGIAEPAGFVPALVHVGRLFGLSAFERALLLLVAGMELDRNLRATVTAADPRGPSLGAALGWLDHPHWDALSPDAPLRAWRLVTLDPGGPLAEATLRIDERILHFLTGIAATDEAIAAIATRLEPAAAPADAVPVAERIAVTMAEEAGSGLLALLEGQEHDPGYRRDIALAVAAGLDRPALWIAATDLPTEAEALRTIARHLDREVALTGALPILAVESSHAGAATMLAGRLRADLLWLGASVPALAGLAQPRRLLRFDLPAPDPASVRDALARRWRRATPPARRDDPAMLAAFDRAARQFHLAPSTLDGVIAQVRAAPDPIAAVWPMARAAGRAALDLIAQRIETGASLDDVVLPAGQQAMIRDIAAQPGQRERVYRDWGVAGGGSRGQGLVALFTGESGTGKTLAAEAIGNAVELDVYRIDLAGMVSKYIGETEKNLKRLFDAAEASGAVLLFDEADALFGKRSEVKDSHDRYANIEVAYLLQRIEAYRGLAILTTNLKGSIDRAFLRRIRFVVPFPFPDPVARERIWRAQFPPAAPLGDVDFTGLARLPLSGGNIRSIAINAAFRAASGSGRIDQATLVTAAREEMTKLERNPSGLGPAT